MPTKKKTKTNVLPPQVLLQPQFWSQLLTRQKASIAWGPDWQLNLEVKPHKKTYGKRQRESAAGIIFRKKF